MSIIERSIRQPVAVAVTVILIVIFGLIGLFQVPVQLTPNVDQPVVSVQTTWFGAQPQEIEQEILQEQEEVLKTIPGLREMTSEAVEGLGTVRLEFYVGIDKTRIINEVEQKLNQVREYPPDADRPVIESVDSSSRDWIAWMLVRPINNDPSKITADKGDASLFRGDVVELEQFLQDFVKPELERGEGVKDVQVLGGRVREMQVRVDLASLASRGVTIDDFVEALRDENRNVSAGAVAQGKRDVSVRAIGQYDDPQQLRDTVVGWTDAGAPVYVSDVAEVGIGFKRQTSFVRSQGQDVMALNAKRETGTNVIEVMDNLKRQIASVNENILHPRGWGLELFQVYDQTVYVRKSVDNAASDLLLGGFLAAAVLFLTLRSIGATLVVAISIPVSVIGTFLGLSLTGRNLNVISMAGLTFAIGMGVDNTIVVLENIFRHREMGKDRLAAAIAGASEVWGAILAATLANIAVFLPVVFIKEEAGQLFQDISIAISISLLLYLFVSPTVIPVLATLFLRKMPGGFVEGGGGAEAHEEKINTGLGRITAPIGRAAGALSRAFYNLTLWFTHGIIRRVALVVVMIVLALAGSWYLIPPRTYLPSGNQNLVFAFVLAPPGYSIEEFRAMGTHIERTIQPWWEVGPEEGDSEQVLADKRAKLKELQDGWIKARDTMIVPMMEQQLAGMKASMPPDVFADASKQMVAELEQMKRSPAPAGIDNFFFVTFEGNVFMGATSLDGENVASLKYLFSQAAQGIPGSFAFPLQAAIFDLGDTFGSSVDVNISGPDYEKVRVAAGMAQGMIMQKMNAFALPNPQNFAIGRAETQVIPDRARAASAGVETDSIRRAALVAVDGEIIGDYREGAKSIDLTVMSNTGSPVDATRITQADALRDVPLATRNGMVVPLSAVATLLPTEAPQRIRRIEEQPAVTLSIQIPSNLTVQEAQTALFESVITPLRQQGIITNDMVVRSAGSADKLENFQKAFFPTSTNWRELLLPKSGVPFGVFGMAAILTYLILAALFGSWLHPFVIIMSVPFALVGGFAGLWILHKTNGALLDVLTMLGFVILVGTIVNNPILIVHQALNYMREGMDRQHAIALSTQTRVRPIFMSVITSVAGMAPLVLGGGAGSELYRGLGAVVIGGLLVSTVFTLFLTPTLMSLMMDMQAGLGRLFTRRGGGGPKPPGKAKHKPHVERMDEELAEPITARTIEPGHA
ncbi:MAG: efflux RND transporter permease subunit [Tepidisphaeraceae bacterium]